MLRQREGIDRRRVGARARLTSLAIDLALLLLLPVLRPWILFLILVRRRGVGSLKERFGGVSVPPPSGPRLWVHTVSVGELEASLPLIGALTERRPDLEIVISTTTTSARALAESRCPELRAFLFPVDLGFCVRRALRHVQPAMILLMELELWPNLILNAEGAGVPVVVANGRISSEGHRSMARFRALLRPFLRRITLYLVQNDEYAARLLDLGVPARRVAVAGNLKLDRPPLASPETVRREFEREWGYPSGGRRWIAGCTHPGEEEPLLAAHRELARRFPGISMILAPRHVERAGEVASKARAAGFRTSRFSERERARQQEPLEVIVVDSIGLLGGLYACADVAFVGGSLVPRGGHNILEPVLAGTPALHGPYTGNFREVVALLTGGGATLEISDATGIARHLAEWLADPGERRRRAEMGVEILRRHRGVAARSCDQILALLLAEGPLLTT